MGEEAAIETGDFAQRKEQDYYDHNCRKRGRIILHYEQMSFYKVESRTIASRRTSTAHWEIDPPAGCPWCYGMPEDLRAVYIEYLAEEERKNELKEKKRRNR